MAIKLIKKITIKEMGAKPDMLKIAAHHNAVMAAAAETPPRVIDPTLWLLAIIGIASDFTVGQGADDKPFVKFVGNFKATNLVTGEVARSGACILPGAIPDLIYGALKGQNGAAQIQFGFKIGVHYQADAITKYVYDVESLAEVADNDPLLMLEQVITQTGKMPQLPFLGQAALPAPAAHGGNGADPGLPAGADNLADTSVATDAEKAAAAQAELERANAAAAAQKQDRTVAARRR